MRRFWSFGAVVALFAALQVGALGCSNELTDPVANEVACKRIFQELQTQCPGGEVDFLNCDLMPGCPAGSVERANLDECVDKIRTASGCTNAVVVECGFDKVDCTARPTSELFDPAIGRRNACNKVVNTFSSAVGTCAVELDTLDPCRSTLVYVATGAGPGACVSDLGLGVTCGTHTDCAVGLRCGSLDACEPALAEGAACGVLGDCLPDLTCRNSVCVAAGAEGDPCNRNTDCEVALFCGADLTCAPDILAGEICVVAGSCTGGTICASGTCQPVGSINDDCTEDGGCGVGLHCNETAEKVFYTIGRTLPCADGGAFALDDFETVLTDAGSKASCQDAISRFEQAVTDAEIRFKFCFDGVVDLE